MAGPSDGSDGTTPAAPGADSSPHSRDGGTADASDERRTATEPDTGTQVGADAVSEYTTAERTLSPAVQLVWAVRVVVGLGILTVVARTVGPRFGIGPDVIGAGLGAFAVLAAVWVHFRYRVWSYRVREDALYLERGVVTKVKTVAPYVRIQHVDTQRGPLERALGLSTLVVYTAGSRGADVSIPGLTTAEADDLQGRVKELAIESEGGDAL